MAALQLLGMEQPFRVVAPCPAPEKPHTPARPTEESRITNDNKLSLVKLRFQMKVAISDKNFSREDAKKWGTRKNGRSHSQLAKKDTGSIFFAPSRLKRESAWLFAKSEPLFSSAVWKKA